MARHSQFKTEWIDKAKELAQKGMTDKEIAKSLGISESALYRYQQRYVEFRKAINEGKVKPNEEVEAALYKRAIGYTMQLRRVVIDPFTSKQTVTMQEEHIPPNVTAQIFFLKNRVPEKWKDTWHGEFDVNQRKGLHVVIDRGGSMDPLPNEEIIGGGKGSGDKNGANGNSEPSP